MLAMTKVTLNQLYLIQANTFLLDAFPPSCRSSNTGTRTEVGHRFHE